jgi:23S rRNA pseudouridine2604 synthase
LTTLKLSKKPSDAPAVVAKKSPVRRSSTVTRDRTTAAVKTQRAEAQQSQANRPERAERDHRPAAPENNSAPRQRNHRHDGALHAQSSAPTRQQTPDSRVPAPRAVQVDARRNSTTSRDKADREGAYRNPPRRGGKARDGFVASEFDNTRSNKEAFATRANASQSEQPRLSKVMAERGICSRREADEWIVNGWVKVNGEIIETLGTRIDPAAEIVISSYAHETQAENVTIILHKPVGYVSGQAEDGYEPAIVLVHPDNQWEDDPELHKHNPKQFHRGMLHGLAPAGRLDIDSTGMLVLTQDGRVARHLIGEDSTVEKEYLVRVTGELSDAGMKLLNSGLSLDGEKLKPAKVSWQNEDQLRFVLREGKKRQIRRMCELVGLHVVGLKRIRIGSITLGKLPVGEWRYLRPEERF